MKNEGITVRPASLNDFGAIQALFRMGDDYHRALNIVGIRTDSADYAHADFDAVLASEASVVLVAALRRDVIGFVRAEQIIAAPGRLRGPLRYVMVHEIVVAEEARGQGIGQKLMQAVRAWTKQHGISSLELNVFSANKAADKFYRHQGFVEHSARLRLDLELPPEADSGSLP